MALWRARGLQYQYTVGILNNPRFLNNGEINSSMPGKVAEIRASSSHGAGPESSSNTGELWTLIESLLGTVVGSLGANGGIVRVVSLSSQKLKIAGAIGLPDEVCEDESVVDIGCGVCGKAACDREIHASETAACAQRPSRHFMAAEYKYVVAAPLEYHGKLVGVITLFFTASADIPDNIENNLRPYAGLIGIALESARKNIENQRIQLMAERQAMANEIHDSLAHTLYYSRMRMSLLLEAVRTQNEELALKCAEDVNEALGNGQKTMREIITHFRCQMDPLGLQYALQTLVNEFRDRTDIVMTYANRLANLELPLEYELQVFHIVREALANVAAHSAATRADLTVECKDGYYVFTIADNGAGCASAPPEGHYGLMIMRERSLRIGGEISIESGEGSGTRVRLRFPVTGVSGI